MPGQPRPKVKKITVEFEQGDPFVIDDPSQYVCLFWGDAKDKEGYKVLEDFYKHTPGQDPKKAKKVKDIWDSQAGVMWKEPNCDPGGWPPA